MNSMRFMPHDAVFKAFLTSPDTARDISWHAGYHSMEKN